MISFFTTDLVNITMTGTWFLHLSVLELGIKKQPNLIVHIRFLDIFRGLLILFPVLNLKQNDMPLIKQVLKPGSIPLKSVVSAQTATTTKLLMPYILEVSEPLKTLLR